MNAILLSSPTAGFTITDRKSKLLYAKYIFFKNGISPKEFDKIKFSDVMAMIEIDMAIDLQKSRAVKINEAMARMR